MENEARVDSSAQDADRDPALPTVEVADLTEAANAALNAAASESIAVEAIASTKATEAICEACTHISDCAAIVQKAAGVIKRIAMAEAAARVILPQDRTWEISEVLAPSPNLTDASSSASKTSSRN